MIAVPDGVILEHELTRDRGIGVQRCLGGAIELLVAQIPDGCGGGRAVAPQVLERRLLRDGRVLRGMRRIHRVHVVHRDAGHPLAGGQCLGQLNLDGIHARHVIDDHANLAAVAGKRSR